MSSDVWSPTRRRLGLAALCLAVGLGVGAAPAVAGPGVQLISDQDAAAVQEVTGAQIAAAADVRSRSYTLRSSTGGAGEKVTLTGLSIRGLLQLAGFDPDSVDFISIARDDGSLATLRRTDFADPSPFREGPALVTDEGGRTRFFRPVRGAGNTNARDNIFVSGGSLDITVGGGALLAVRARASPRKPTAGRTVRFRARVRFPPPGASFTYQWDFGDGTSGTGADATHKYKDEGDFQAQVTVEGTGGTGAVCQDTCGGVATANVRVGKARTSPRPDTQSGSGNANPNGTGTSGTGSGSGGSGSGSGGVGGTSPDPDPDAKPAPRDSGEPAPRADSGAAITGILLASSPTVLKSTLPALQRAGGKSTAARAARAGAEGGGRLGGSVLATIALIMVGALYERRRATLRVA
jgi:hypothetical protein